MPSFCRHNRLIQNCPICAREQAVELRPVVSSGPSAAPSPGSRPAAGGRSSEGTGRRGAGAGRPASATRRTARSPGARSGGLRVSHLERGGDDGYSSPLVPGLRSSRDARRLAEELADSLGRLERLRTAPWDLYAEAADPAGELEERTWLCFQMACLGPVEGEDPWALVRAARTSWASGQDPALTGTELGRRSAGSTSRLFGAYRAWAARAGSQAAGYSGESGWTPARRFSRVYERLALPGLDRDARYELLVVLGALGLYALEPQSLHLGRHDEVAVAAKRVFGIGDPLLLDRRAAALAASCEIPLAAFDLGLYSWGCGNRPDYGLSAAPDEALAERIARALGLSSQED